MKLTSKRLRNQPSKNKKKTVSKRSLKDGSKELKKKNTYRNLEPKSRPKLAYKIKKTKR